LSCHLRFPARGRKPAIDAVRFTKPGIHLMRAGGVIEANLLTLTGQHPLPQVPELVARKLAGPEAPGRPPGWRLPGCPGRRRDYGVSFCFAASGVSTFVVPTSLISTVAIRSKSVSLPPKVTTPFAWTT